MFIYYYINLHWVYFFNKFIFNVCNIGRRPMCKYNPSVSECLFFCPGKKKNLKEVLEMITCFYFLLPTTTRNEMISHLDRWENHCLMPAGWFLCSSFHFKHNMQQLSWIQRTTFNFIQNLTVVLCFHHAGELGTAPRRWRGQRLTSTATWHLHLKSKAKHFLRLKVQLCMFYSRLLNCLD